MLNRPNAAPVRPAGERVAPPAAVVCTIATPTPRTTSSEHRAVTRGGRVVGARYEAGHRRASRQQEESWTATPAGGLIRSSVRPITRSHQRHRDREGEKQSAGLGPSDSQRLGEVQRHGYEEPSLGRTFRENAATLDRRNRASTISRGGNDRPRVTARDQHEPDHERQAENPGHRGHRQTGSAAGKARSTRRGPSGAGA